VGSTPQSYDVYAKLEGASLSDSVTLPTDGRTLYVTLWSSINGAWQANAYQYTAFTNTSGPVKAAMLSPSPGATLAATTVFTWNAGKGVTQYLLWVGSTPQSYDVHAKLEGVALSDTVALPRDGRTVYVTLWSLINGAWQASAYSYRAATN